MITLQDALWKTFKGGYRELYDPSECLRKLAAGIEDEAMIWEELWNELHHQGDVDLASYAAVPQLVSICIIRNLLDWNLFALTATIEQCRVFSKNPPLPEWLEKDYHSALKELALYGARRISEDWSPELSRMFLAVAAFAKGLPQTGRVLLEFTDDEIATVSNTLFD